MERLKIHKYLFYYRKIYPTTSAIESCVIGATSRSAAKRHFLQTRNAVIISMTQIPEWEEK